MSSSSRSSPLSPARSPSPIPPVQPNHFYGQEDIQLPPSPDSDGKTWLDPEDDPFAQRGIPVFKPTMDEFRDFEEYMTRIEPWGMKSGIVKVIPPTEWTQSLPPVTAQLAGLKMKNPIEQLMVGRGGLFRQQNVEKRRELSVREWAELCTKDEFRAPSTSEVGLPHARAPPPANKVRPSRATGRRKGAKAGTAEPAPEPESEVKEEPTEDDADLVTPVKAGASAADSILSPPNTSTAPATPVETVDSDVAGKAPSVMDEEEIKPKGRSRRVTQTKEAKEAKLAESAVLDEAFLERFDPANDWLPTGTKPADYTPEFCRTLERHYWRNCGLGRPAWYGADTAGSLFTASTDSWNVGKLPSMLSRLLPPGAALPGVNSPYLYFGMWRATFAWHVEDMDLFSINYIHFGAGKFWYAIPQARSTALETTMKGYFPKDIGQCPQFLRHKSFFASPTLLAQSSCRPNTLVQNAGEFVITYPMGYHAGFNLGFNCAESVNFALDSWLDLGRKAKVCECINDSVRIDVDQLLLDREAERLAPKKSPKKDGANKSSPRKRKDPPAPDGTEARPRSHKKKPKVDAEPSGLSGVSGGRSMGLIPGRITSVKLKLPPKPKEPEGFPCCLCVSTSRDGLLRVHDPPRDAAAAGMGMPDGRWMAHEVCADVVPETWVDEVDGPAGRERVVFGVDGIVRDRWNLKCTACLKNKPKAHGAPIQCTKGKCSKAFHVSCAQEGDGAGIVFKILQHVEKEVVLTDLTPQSAVEDRPGPTISATDAGMAMDALPVAVDPQQPDASMASAPEATIDPRILKVIRKAEYQLLCHQHNPAVAQAKKNNKAERIRTTLMALPEMSRIKLRVSAGVFEVSLVRVIPETDSVEVIWDKGVKKEFKFSSVALGHKDGVVGHKPTEVAPPVTDYTGFLQASGLAVVPPLTSEQYLARPPPPQGVPMQYAPAPMAGPSDYATSAWAYQHYQTAAGYQPPAATYTHPHPGVHQPVMPYYAPPQTRSPYYPMAPQQPPPPHQPQPPPPLLHGTHFGANTKAAVMEKYYPGYSTAYSATLTAGGYYRSVGVAEPAIPAPQPALAPQASTGGHYARVQWQQPYMGPASSTPAAGPAPGGAPSAANFQHHPRYDPALIGAMQQGAAPPREVASSFENAPAPRPPSATTST